MKRARVLYVLLLCVLVAVLAGCAKDDGGVSSTVIGEARTTTVPSLQSNDPAKDGAVGIGGESGPYWEVDSLDALNALVRNADGHAYYYIFKEIPAGLKVVRVGLRLDMSNYNITFEDEKGQFIELFVFTMTEGLKDASGFDTMVVDGVTYYYHQRADEQGIVYVSYFEWHEYGKVFLVHPQEPITPDVIRKYNTVRKVEFNASQKGVGLDTGTVLISDMDKIRAVVRANPGVHYHTGVIEPGKDNDLLEP